MDFSSLPEGAQHCIISYLELNDLSNFQKCSSSCLKLAEDNYLWYEKLRNDFPYEEYNLKFTNHVRWKEIYKNLNQKCDATYWNQGYTCYSGQKYSYKFEYFLATKQMKKYKEIRGKESSFEIYGMQIGPNILFFQYKLTKDYYAAVLSKKFGNYCLSRWITDQRKGYAFSRSDENSYDKIKKDLDQVKDLLQPDKHPFEFSNKLIVKKTSQIYEFDFNPIFKNHSGWIYSQLNKDNHKIDGIFNDYYFLFVMDTLKLNLENTNLQTREDLKEISMHILFIEKDKKIEEWKGFVSFVEINPNWIPFTLSKGYSSK